MLRSSYSESAYGRMRDRQAEKEKQARESETISDKKKQHVPYKTLMAIQEVFSYDYTKMAVL